MPSKPIRTVEVRRKVRTYLFIGIAAFAILIITLATAGRQQNLRCERLDLGEVDCIARDSILGVITLGQKSIPGAQAVAIGQECVDVACKYRLEIYATQGLVPIKEKYTSNYNQLVNIKSQINEFFSDKTRSFVAMKEETNPLLILAVASVVVLIWAYLGYLVWEAQRPRVEERLEQ